MIGRSAFHMHPQLVKLEMGLLHRHTFPRGMLSDASFQEECTSAEMNLSLAKNADSLKEVEREATASAARAKASESISTPKEAMCDHKR